VITSSRFLGSSWFSFEYGLPVVLLATVIASLSVLHGVVDGVHHGGVLVSNVHTNKLVSLVDHLGGGEVVGGKVGVLAGGSLDAGQLLLGTGHEHHEAHSAGHIGGGDDGLFRRSSGSTHGEEAEAEDESFENQKDQKICQIQCENF